MATTLSDHQFELLREDADTGVAFGIGLPVSVDASGFDPGTNDWLVQDQDDPFSGATRMGRDVRTGSTWAWSMHTDQTSEVDALSVLDDLADLWSPDDLGGGEVMVMRYAVGGRTRRVYGRPRRFASPPDNRILGGMVPVTADFKRVDPMFYDDSLETVSLGLAYESEGGFIFPVTFPVLTLPGGYQPGEAFVGGKRRTWPIIRFNGPVTNPELLAPNWTLSLTTTIAEGHYIEIDTRPWMRTVTMDGTSSVPGALSAKTRLRDLYLTPGHQSFGLRGISAEGTGNATIKWYPAYASL
jgi:hypothetical protein